MNVLALFNKEQLELAGKVIGLAGPALAALRAAFGYAQAHSLERRRVKIMQDIDSCLKRIDRVGAHKNRSAALQTFDEYLSALAEDLAVNQIKLAEIRRKKARLELKKKEDPQGIRKWLSLYKPEGIDGWISQTFFYLFAISVVVIIASGVALAWQRDSTGWFLIPASGIYFAIACYFWAVSLRLRRIGNAQRRGELGTLNADLSAFRKIFLILSGEKLRIALYYLCFLEILAFPVAANLDEPDPSARLSWTSIVLVVGLFALIAEILRADALSRRGLRTAGFSLKK